MSFLLDALRKSQSQRERGNLPDLHTQLANEPVGAPVRNPWPWVLVAFLVLAAIIAWRAGWLGAPDRPSAVATNPQPENVAETQPRAAVPEPVILPEPETANGPRTPLDRFQPSDEAQADPTGPTASAAPTASESRLEAPEPIAAQPVLLDPRPEPIAEPERKEALQFWELPATVRSELPSFNISVLVYAEDPESRFVLMNGRRFVEGDSVAEDVTLDEVRRDGAVMRYGMYRFLVTQ